MKRALVYGLAITGEAVAAGLMTHGYDVVIADDQPTPVRIATADRLGTELIGAPEVDEIVRLMESCDLVCPAPGVPENHDVIRAAVAVGVPVVTELDLAYEWEAERPGGPRPMLAVTGTDGKTTTTMLIGAMLRAAGRRAVEVGNTGLGVFPFMVRSAELSFDWLNYQHKQDPPLSKRLNALSGVPKLFIEASDEQELAELTRQLYVKSPEPREQAMIPHGNFAGLAEEDKRTYENRVVSFFLSHLPATGGPVR